jgi:hypothetical protein
VVARRTSKHPKREKPCADCAAPFVGTAPARYCPACRWKHRGRKEKKYSWTPERDAYLREHYDSRVRGRAAAIGARYGWPAWVVRRRAGELGLAHPWPADRRDWTEEEETFLLNHAGSRHVNWMAKQLGRSITSVVLKLKRMKISRCWREGYTLRELELCFGTDHHVIERWVREGKLEIRKRGTERERDAWLVTDAQILRFIQNHPLAFRLDKVDQVWFLDLVLAGGLIRRALRIESTDEDLDELEPAAPVAATAAEASA